MKRMRLRHIGRRSASARCRSPRPARRRPPDWPAVTPSGSEPSSWRPSTSSVWPASRSARVSPMQTIAVRPGAPGGLRLGADLGVGFLVQGAPLGMADDHGAGAGVLEHLGGDVAGEGAGGFGMAILAADRDRRAAAPARRRPRAASPAGRPSDRPCRPVRPRRPRSCRARRPSALSPFIFQLPATSGRRRRCGHSSPLDASG